MDPNFNLTIKQRELLRLLRQRERLGIPTVQRDLAEALGIRRDSLNKLLTRLRTRLARQGAELPVPPRRSNGRVSLNSLGVCGPV